MTTKILAVDDNAVNLKLVQATLGNIGFDVFTASSGMETLGLLEKIEPDLIVLDISMPEMDGYEVCQRIRANPRTMHIPVVMLTANDTLEEKIKGFQVGADEYIVKPFQPAEFQMRIRAMIRRQETLKVESKKMDATIIGVFSLRGGVGVSTIATNLSISLAQIWKMPVALIDMAYFNGQSALMCNLPLKNTWADLTRSPVDELDSEIIRSTMLLHESGVQVMAAPRRAEESELITPELTTKVITEIKPFFQYIILDLAHDFSPVTLSALDNVNETIVIMAPELASVRVIHSALEVFTTLDYDLKSLHLCINWIFEKRGLARKDIEGVLKKQTEYVIPFAPDIFVPAINFGKPPAWSEPESPIAALFEDMAFILSKEEDRKSNPKVLSAALARIRERESAKQKK